MGFRLPILVLRSLLGYWKEETYLKFLYQAWESSLAEPHSPQARFPTLCYFLAESCSASTPAQVLTLKTCNTPGTPEAGASWLVLP